MALKTIGLQDVKGLVRSQTMSQFEAKRSMARPISMQKKEGGSGTRLQTHWACSHWAFLALSIDTLYSAFCLLSLWEFPLQELLKQSVPDICDIIVLFHCITSFH